MIETISLTTLTAAGTVTSVAPVHGELLAFHVASNSEGTATLAIATSPTRTIASLAGAGTSWYSPRVQGCDGGGTAISGVYDTIPLYGYVTFGINAAGTASVALVIDR
jgi:hypothetical protein